MEELILLNQFNSYLNSLNDEQWIEVTNNLNLDKLEKRSKELLDEFLSDYAIDKGVTTN